MSEEQSEVTVVLAPGDVTVTVRTLEVAVQTLREQLDIANRRADQAEKDARDLRRRLDVSQAAERRAHDEAERRRAELEAAWEWGLLRRLRWALSRKW